jgi:uncharacterized protein
MQITCIVKPKSKVDSLSVNPDGSLRIKIKAPPVDGKANEYLIEYLSEVFKIKKKNIEIISGHTNSHKRINIVESDQQVKETLRRLAINH